MIIENTLTLTLPHPMGEGKAAGYFRFYECFQPASTLDSTVSGEHFSLSR
jgi:hypothetical protein